MALHGYGRHSHLKHPRASATEATPIISVRRRNDNRRDRPPPDRSPIVVPPLSPCDATHAPNHTPGRGAVKRPDLAAWNVR